MPSPDPIPVPILSNGLVTPNRIDADPHFILYGYYFPVADLDIDLAPLARLKITIHFQADAPPLLAPEFHVDM